MKTSSSPFHVGLMQACNHEGMQMMRRVLLLGMLLLIPVLLATAGTFLSAPSGPPAVDATPVELGPGPDGAPAHGLEPAPAPAPGPGGAASDTGDVPRTQPEAPPAAPPVHELPAAPVPVRPAEPVPVLPPVVIDDDDDEADDDGDGDGAGEDNDQ